MKPEMVKKLQEIGAFVLAGGCSKKRIKEVAAELGLSATTVQTYLRCIYEKLQVHSQAEAVAKFLR